MAFSLLYSVHLMIPIKAASLKRMPLRIDFGSSIRIYTLERGEKLGESEYIKWEDALEDFAERIELNYTKRIKKGGSDNV